MNKYITPYKDPYGNMCLPCCYKVVLDDLFRRKKMKTISFRKVREICEYSPLNASSIRGSVPNLNMYLDKKFRRNSLQVRYVSGIQSTIKKISGIVRSDDSFPIAIVMPQFAQYAKNLDYSLQEGTAIWLHAIVVTGVKKEKVFFFDPWVKKYENINNNNDWINTYIDITHFSASWDKAEKRSIWIENRTKSSEQQKLPIKQGEQYG